MAADVDIVGGGAMGMLYGARLALAGSKVRIWTRTSGQAKLLRQEGIRFTDLEGKEAVVPVIGESRLPGRDSSAAGGTGEGELAGSGVQPDSAWGAGEAAVSGAGPAFADERWILLAVKQTAIGGSLFELLRHLAAPQTPVICLQNGIGHMEKLSGALPDIPFFQAVTTEGALRTGPAEVRHTGAGELWIARRPASAVQEPSAGILDNLKRAAEDLGRASVAVHFSDETETMAMRKLLVNAVINPLTAICGVRNGELPAHPSRLGLMRALYEETKAVLEAARGRTFEEDMWALVLRVCEATAGNESSMLADVKANRRTEVRWINGGVCGMAAGLNLAAPLNEAMVTLVERLSQNRV